MTYVIAQPCLGVKDNSYVEVCPEDDPPEQWAAFKATNAAFFR